MLRTVVLAALIVSTSIAAQDANGLKLGAAILGAKPETEALKGRVLFVELWGIH